MIMYQTYKYDDNDNIIIINEYDDLLEAYQSIDTNCKIYNFREYYITLFNKIVDVPEFQMSYYKQIIRIVDSLYKMTDKLDDIVALFISTMQETDIPYFITNDIQYIVDLNNIIESELNLRTFIRKNPNIIINDLKCYFQNHVNEFLYIVDVLIEYNLYDHFDWRRKNNIQVENEIQYNKLYKSEDVYNSIKYDTIYSSSEYDVLQDYITDLDHIIEVFVDNIYIIKNLQISQDLASIIRYL